MMVPEGGKLGLRRVAVALLRAEGDATKIARGAAESGVRVARIQSYESSGAGVRLHLGELHLGDQGEVPELTSTLLLAAELPLERGQRLNLQVMVVPLDDENETAHHAAILRGQCGLYLIVGEPLSEHEAREGFTSGEGEDIGRWPVMHALQRAYQVAQRAADADDHRIAS